jgi:hypothetical protein
MKFMVMSSALTLHITFQKQKVLIKIVGAWGRLLGWIRI